MLRMRCIGLIPLALAGPTSAAEATVFEPLSAVFDVVAQGLDILVPDEIEGVRATVGVGMGVTPAYRGSDNSKFKAVPILDLRYKDIAQLAGNRLTVNLIKTPDSDPNEKRWRFRAGPSAVYDFGRDVSQSDDLAGVDHVRQSLNLGAFAEVRRHHTALVAEYVHATRGGYGGTLRLTAAQGLFQSGDWQGGMAVRARIIDDAAARTRYGVSAQAALASGLPSYRPSGGLETVGLQALTRYTINRHWRLDFFAAAERVMGDAAKSPIVKTAGARNQITAGVGLEYTF